MAFVCHRLDDLGTYTAPIYTLYSAIFISFLPQDPAIMHRGLDYRVRARIHWATDFVVILSPWPSPGSHDQLPVTAPTHVRFTCHLRLVLKGRPRLKTPLSPRLRSRTWPQTSYAPHPLLLFSPSYPLTAFQISNGYPSLQMELEAPEVQFKAKSPGHQLPHLVAVFLSWLTVTSEIDNVQRPSRIH
ncbi:hypothetical protein CY34DRAFT_401320 [Suillus luteus UH-Slu-Lm8-n1]|uniref:Unplaced genomic scaffold CY34scaffold_27, whole genome shotgun sequence n=1 Tax=Suillus luteus UH-Slu-Lm8-n1 TaxID=930992 RepID=A0A0D0AXX6_9AGAM|nr:hypothetical protein CY34DRAFT_401320 [Suillus luteus UH-Slu-Lm8-n1]